MIRRLMAAVVVTASLTLGLRAGDDETPKPKEVIKAKEAALNIKGELTDDDAKDKVQGGPSKTYDLAMTAGKVYIIDLKSKAFDALLRLEDASGKQVAINDDATPDTLDSRIVYTAKATAKHKIIATSLDRKTGAFTLTARVGTAKDATQSDPFFKLIGKQAPEIVSAHTLNGKAKKLSELKGKVVLLDFWAVWCARASRRSRT